MEFMMIYSFIMALYYSLTLSLREYESLDIDYALLFEEVKLFVFGLPKPLTVMILILIFLLIMSLFIFLLNLLIKIIRNFTM